MSKNSTGEYVIEPWASAVINWKELWRYRELLFFFTWRDVKVKYKQTVLGFLWAILQPLLMMVILTFFMGRALKVPSDDMPYPVFAFSGLLLWSVFSSGIINAGNSMVSNAQIIKKIYFPRLIIPVSSILVAVVDFGIAFIILLILIVFFHQHLDLLDAIIFWPLGLILAILSAFGPGCLLAALNVKYRDFRYVIPFLAQVLLFVTPVIYPLSIISNPWLKYALVLNPMYGAITLFRLPMMEHAPEISMIWLSIASCILFFFIGLTYFRRTEMYFADLA